MFNLNDKSFDGGVAIFNGGVAGKVNNVGISVDRKKSTDPDNSPDYKVYFKDAQGALINQGFYYHKDNEMYDEKRNKDLEVYLVSRVLSIAKAVVGKDYTFAEYQTSKEAIDGLFKLINENSADKTVNVFVTYGTTTKPSQYLGLRYFNFVESTDASPSRLVKNNTDQMERIVADAPQTEKSGSAGSWQ
jgi:hypothetical protein